MNILKLCFLFCMSILLSCSSHSVKKQTEEKQTEEKEYTSPSSSPGPYPGLDPTATAIA